MKELQRELEDSRAAQKEVLASAREAERRSKAMEADIFQLQEVRPTSGELRIHASLSLKLRRLCADVGSG